MGKNTYNSINFTYDKFREIQNLDWAEECVNVGVRMCENSTPQAALEYFDNAIQLDILNKEAYYWKALALTRIVIYIYIYICVCREIKQELWKVLIKD